VSSRWERAARKFAAYRTDVPAKGDGRASNFMTHTVMRELAWIAHDAGVVQTTMTQLVDRVGASERSIRYALDRLQRDGWVVEVVRGTGNRQVPGEPRGSVYVLRPLPDAQGELLPAGEWLSAQWPRYSVTARYVALSRHHRAAVAAAVWGRYESHEQVPMPPPITAGPRLRRVQ